MDSVLRARKPQTTTTQHKSNPQVQVFDRDPSADHDITTGPPAPPTAVLEMDTCAEVAACFHPAPRFAEDWDEAYGPTAVRVRGRLLDPVTGACVCGRVGGRNGAMLEESVRLPRRPSPRQKNTVTGKPAPLALGKRQTLRACLRLGHCFLDRQGQLSTPPPPSTAPTPSPAGPTATTSAFSSSYGSSSGSGADPGATGGGGGRPGLRKGSSGVASLFASMRFRRDSSSVSGSNHNHHDHHKGKGSKATATTAAAMRHHLSYGGAGDPGAATASSMGSTGLDDGMTRTCIHTQDLLFASDGMVPQSKSQPTPTPYEHKPKPQLSPSSCR